MALVTAGAWGGWRRPLPRGGLLTAPSQLTRASTASGRCAGERPETLPASGSCAQYGRGDGARPPRADGGGGAPPLRGGRKKRRGNKDQSQLRRGAGALTGRQAWQEPAGVTRRAGAAGEQGAGSPARRAGRGERGAAGARRARRAPCYKKNLELQGPTRARAVGAPRRRSEARTGRSLGPERAKAGGVTIIVGSIWPAAEGLRGEMV